MQHQLHPIAPYFTGQIVGYVERPVARPRVDIAAGCWYLLQTCGGREFEVAADVERNGMAAYVPACWVNVRCHANRHRKVRRPLYPGYVFVRFDATGEEWSSLPGIDGVVRLFMWDFVPITIADEVIAQVREMARVIEAGGVPALRDTRPVASVGEAVRLAGRHSLAGILVIAAAVDTDRRMIRVDFDLLGRRVPQWLGEDRFERL